MMMQASSTEDSWLLYGAYGFTGELVARRAVAVGERPILCGRDAARLEALATELDLEWRVAVLDDPAALARALRGVRAVAHCAGPFSATATAMVDACIAGGVHYCDITGEIDVLEAIIARSAEAETANVALLPGSGFDVVPTDCLAAMTVAALPDATSLEIAFRSQGGVSRGTARSALESIGRMSLCRRGGAIVDVPSRQRRRFVDFARGRVEVTAISWGDVSTAFHSTGVGDITVSTQLPAPTRIAAGVLSTAVRLPLAGSLTTRGLRWAANHMPNPTSESMAVGGAEIWVRARNEDAAIERMLATPDGYALTADAVVRIVARLAAGTIPAGAHTPSQALGPEFVLELDGVRRC